ncbi:MAG TPA: zf-HC2 domain-containing protein [Myxococcales bacterium]|nr:zf-HC2 domain-containing protein [Myxococcales bacterium]
MKRCAEVVPLLGPLLDGALPDDDGLWVADHLRGCSSCRDRQALIAAQGAALREALAARSARLDLSGFTDRVLARVAAQPDHASRTPVWGREMWWAHKGALSAAGGLLAAACMALAVFLAPNRPDDDSGPLADNSPQVEEVDFGTRDGAVLQLPAQTTVIWMSDDRGIPQ